MDQREILKRGKEITIRYFEFLDKHIDDVFSGKVIEFMEINQIASELFVSHTHLTDTLQRETTPVIFMILKLSSEPNGNCLLAARL